MECRVEYDYVAQEEDELSLKKGDIITNVTQKMDGWWEGTLRGKTAMFPDNFVSVIEKKSSTSTTSSAPTEPEPLVKKDSGNNGVTLRCSPNKTTRRLKALFSYSPEQEDELKLDIGDVIDFVAEVEEGWWRGKLKGRVGIFPSNFVSDVENLPTTNGKAEPEHKQNEMSKVNNSKVVPDVPPAVPVSAPPDEDDPPTLPPKKVRELAKCFYPYQASNEDELTLTEGDIVTIISKKCEDEGWWRGELKGKNGLFPDNFVRIINSSSNEASNQNKANFVTSTASSNANKISPQAGGRNLKSVQPLPSAGVTESNVTEKTNGSSVVDGVGNSKMQDKEKEKEKPAMSKMESAKALFSKSFSSGPKPTTPTSPSSPGIFGGFAKSSDIKKQPSFGKEDRKSDEEEFNSVERGEKLNHLTAKRAKAPKRRPPSTLIPRENDVSMTNGSLCSQESIDSPPVNSSTPFNSTVNSSASAYGTPSGSILDASSISASGSFLSQSKDNDSSATSPANGTGGAAKPKKLLPWMAELKQKQDKKQGLTSPVTSTAPNALNGNNITASSPSVSSPTSLPSSVSTLTSPAIAVKEKEPIQLPVPVRAPPLPVKPSSLATSASVDKTTGLSPSTATAPLPSVANRGFGKKPPILSPVQGTQGNNFVSGHDANAGGSGGGDSRQFVPFDEYAKLRDRVIVLEAELETVRRQVKILLDRELNHGHIV